MLYIILFQASAYFPLAGLLMGIVFCLFCTASIDICTHSHAGHHTAGHVTLTNNSEELILS